MAVRGLVMSATRDFAGPSAASRLSGYNAWSEAVGDIDALIHDHQHAPTEEYTGISNEHWQKKDGVRNCMNRTCKKPFSMKERPHHCRRCGLVFCNACSAYRRKLNLLTHPDPAGNAYRVCKACFEDPQTLGAVRDLMTEYKSVKWCLSQGLHQQTNGASNNQRVSIIPGIHNRLDALQQLDRLVTGFQSSLTLSTIKWAAKELKGLVLAKKPSWKLHKNNIYEKMVPACRSCRNHFSVLLQRHFCTVCGAATCTTCGKLELIVYVPNQEDKNSDNTSEEAAQWAIIKIVGCPEKEPDICMYLRVCDGCKTRLTEIQAQDVYQEAVDMDVNQAWSYIEKVFNTLSDIQRKINTQLPKYKELIDCLEISPGSAQALPSSNRSNTQVLAKAQEDLSDHFTQLVMTIHGVKSHKPPTKGQATVMHNIVKSKVQYYQESMFTFRELKRRLEAVTPLQVLTVIQDIVDHNAINSCYLLVKQLILEVLNLHIRNKIPDTLMGFLTPLEQITLEDLEKSVRKSGENFDEHIKHVNQLLQLQLKHHLLIRLKENLIQNQYKQAVNQRVAHILQKVQLQLVAKVADRSFPKTKAALEKTLNQVESR